MSTGNDGGFRGHSSSELEESNNRSSKCDTTCNELVGKMFGGTFNFDVPIRTPRYAVTMWRVVRSSTWPMALPILVRTAARPTTECRAATV